MSDSFSPQLLNFSCQLNIGGWVDPRASVDLRKREKSIKSAKNQTLDHPSDSLITILTVLFGGPA